MIIKHRPLGGTPYFITGLERLPANPKPGDTIKINAMVEGADQFDATLYWTHNGIDQTPIKPVHLKSRFSNGEGGDTVFHQYNLKEEPLEADTTGKPYISFTLGAFDAYDQIDYWIECKTENETVQSGRYLFEILNPISFDAVEKICADQGMLRIYFAAAEALHPVLTIYFREGRLRFTHGWGTPELVACDPCTFTKSKGIYTYTSKQFRQKVVVTLKPFSLVVTDDTDRVLYKSIPGDPYMVLYHGKISGIRQWDLCLKMDNEYFMGFGERFNAINQKGRHVHNYNIEIFCEQGPVTYLPIPFFMTERRFGIHIDTPYHVDMDMGATEEDTVYLRMDTEGEKPIFDYTVYFGEPKEIIQAFTGDTGKPALPPKWTFGLWMSSNRWNTQREALIQAANIKRYDIPATVLVLEAWTDECTMYLINDSQYEPVPGERALRYRDLTFSKDGKWPDFKDFADALHDTGLKLVLWQVPVVKEPVGEDYSPQAEKDDEAAWNNGYGVTEPDGTPHRKPYKWFEQCQVPDFTNSEASEWFMEKRRYLIDEVGVDGFKTDGGEFIRDDDLRFSNGKSGREMRNLYTPLYLEAYHTFMGRDRVLFSRGGYTGAQQYPVYWAGDQASTYEEMRSILRGGLSLALCGNPFWGFDIAGFARDMPSAELYIRSAQMGAFCPVMQYHSAPVGGFFGDEASFNNDRTPWNMAEHTGEKEIIPLFRYLANLRMNMLPYIYREAVHCVQSHEPMMRPLLLDYPDEQAVYGIDDQYLFGRDILVAPLLTEGTDGRDVYLPRGQWIDFFTHREYRGGQSIRYDCGWDTFPVFIRKGAVIPLNLNQAMELGGSIGNDIDRYQKLTFWVTDPEGLSYDFNDEFGNHVHIRYDHGHIEIDIKGPVREVFVLSDESFQCGGEQMDPHIWRFCTK